MLMWKRLAWKTLRPGLVAAAALATTACSSDPAMWEAIALGLDQAAAELEYENAYCYWATPPGLPVAVNQKYCPGDYGYRDFWIPPESPYWRDRYQDHRRDQRRDHDRGHNGSHDGDHRRDHDGNRNHGRHGRPG